MLYNLSILYIRSASLVAEYLRESKVLFVGIHINPAPLSFSTAEISLSVGQMPVPGSGPKLIPLPEHLSFELSQQRGHMPKVLFPAKI